MEFLGKVNHGVPLLGGVRRRRLSEKRFVVHARTMNPRHRRSLSILASAVIAYASLIGAAGSASAATLTDAPSDLSVALLSPHATDTTGANISYTSVSGWRNTNVVVTLPGWTALSPFASTGSAPCPASVTVTAKPAGGGKATFSQCTWTQASGSAILSMVVTSSSGLNGQVAIALSEGMLANPTAPASYAVRMSEQSDAGWVTLSDWTAIDVPSDFELSLLSPAPSIVTPATATYTSASGWAGTNIVLTLPGFIAQNTFTSTGSAPCPTGITVTATPATATVTQCSWTQSSGSAVFAATINAPNTGLAGTVTIAFASGTLQNPAAPAQYMARLSEQSSAGWVSMDWWVNVGVPVELTASLTSVDAGASTGAVITYDSGSQWVATNVSILFPGWTALKTFTSTGSKACPAVVKVVATPASATTSECSWTQGSAGATLSFVLNSPGYGLQGPVRTTLAKGLLTNPETAGSAVIRLTEQSGAGWVGLSTDVTLRAA